ncbi:hypothetical protein D1B33_02435 [Lysinibacillus yapensis]|uniref:Uncharacterized protein n=1 Tax=Ureibacillus yapensis TaxID=2304605 RepID=A0A396SHG7_9BACL|nr:hypothetical protein D1B33_02435 [Lysinibacillus yapensis]
MPTEVSLLSLNCFFSLSGKKKNMHQEIVQFHPEKRRTPFSPDTTGGTDKRALFALLGSTEVVEGLAFAAGHPEMRRRLAQLLQQLAGNNATSCCIAGTSTSMCVGGSH